METLSMFSKEQIWTSNNIPRTNSLFKETCRPGDVPIMSLTGGDESLPCLRTLYVNLTVDDPSEATFAETVFGDIRYWFKLREAKFMPAFLNEWREEADIKRKRKAFKAIIKEVEENGRSAFTAAKYLVEEPWKGNTQKAKATKKATTKKALTAFDEDLERLTEEGLLN